MNDPIVNEIKIVIDVCFVFQTLSISMYFGVSWLDPRLVINDTAEEWNEVKTGPKNVSTIKLLQKISFLAGSL